MNIDYLEEGKAIKLYYAELLGQFIWWKRDLFSFLIFWCECKYNQRWEE